MSDLVERARELLRRPRAVAATGGLVLAAAMLLLAAGGRPPPDDFEVLVADAPDPSELLRVASLLCEKGVPHRLEDGGRTLRVLGAHRDEAQALLLEGGLGGGAGPGEGQDAGFLGFSPSMDLSPDAYRARRRRASESELARTISLYPGVRFARVHLNLPEPGAFGKSSAMPTASIFLGIKGGRRISSAQARAVRALVSHAVKGMDVEQVVLADSLGTNYEAMIRDDEREAELEEAGTHLGVLREAEERAEAKLLAHLLPLFGPAHVRVSVTARVCREPEDAAHAVLLSLGDDAGAAVSHLCLRSAAVSLDSGVLPSGLTEDVRELVLGSARPALGLPSRHQELVHVQAAAFVSPSTPPSAPRGEPAPIPIPVPNPVDPAGGDMGLPLGVFLLMTGALGVTRLARHPEPSVGSPRRCAEEMPDPELLREDPHARRVAASCWSEEDPSFAARIASRLVHRDDREARSGARLLVALGPQVAPDVLAVLDEETVREVLGQVAGLDADPELGYLDPGLEPTLWLATQRALSKDGPRQARRVAQEIWGPFAGDATLEEIDRLWEEPLSSDGVEAAPAAAPEARTSALLAERLGAHSSAGAALALALAPRALARRTLVDLVDAGRHDVPLWIACLESAFPHVLELPEQGEEVLAELLDGLRIEVRERILATVQAQDLPLWERLYDRGFTIRELEAMDDRDLGELLGRAGAEDLALALREAPEQLRQRCMRCMPRALRTLTAQGMDGEQPLRMRDLERARERLGALCRDLGLRGGEHGAV